MYTTILTLYKQGNSERKISKLTKTHRSTVKKIIQRYLSDQIESPIPYSRKSEISSWHEKITELLATKLSVVRIFEKLKECGFNKSYNSLSLYIRKHNIKNNTCIRFHTKSGEEAQVDFGDVGRQYDKNGKHRKAYVFNMRLSYSRLDYYEVVFDQTVDTWIKCHINAFKFFGGVPQIIKLDNLKAGVINANFHEPIYQKEYKRLANHYGCWLSPCRPYQPQEKGKVESGIKYVKNNFFAGRKFDNNKEMSYQLNKWLALANTRIHGTTKSRPNDIFQKEESSCLIKLPLEEFDMAANYTRKVHKDCHIILHNNYYSVPSKYVSQEVLVLLSSNLVKIYVEDELIATHARSNGNGVFTTNTAHYAKNKLYCPGFEEHDNKYQEEIIAMGNNCKAIMTSLKEQRKNDWHRGVRGIIKLRKLYSDTAIDKACERAMYYGLNSYNKVKKILENNSYQLPLSKSNEGGDHANIA